MKKWYAAAALGALVFCLSASVWEGAAAVGLNGELPEGGFYVATKSFPRNTVVDVTNLESGKTIRAIVASTLDSPGLLTVLSREAAEVIGLQSRSVGRVRMTMPSDPVAFSRFTEGLGSNGDPDFDPRASVAANTAVSGQPLPGQPLPNPLGPAVPPMTALEPAYPDPWNLAASPYPQTAPVEALTNDGNKYDYTGPSAEPVEEIPAPGPLYFADAAETYDPPPARAADDSIVPEPFPLLAWTRPEEGNPETALTEPPLVPEIFNTLPSIQNVIGVNGDVEPPYPQESAELLGFPETAPYPAPVLADPYGFSLIPAPERPPEGGGYNILPPEAEIPPLENTPPALSQAPEDEDFHIDPSLFIDPLPESAALAAEPAPESPRESPPESPPVPPETPPAPEAPSAAETFLAADETPGRGAVSAPTEPPRAAFSVPLISRLERGKYYVQLGAFSRPETAEFEISRIGPSYPLTIQAGGSQEKPLYRVLLGPVNLGESGALLQRFRGNGFNDAFIRQDG